MKTNTNLREVNANSTSTTAFTIQGSGKMFQLLIAGLYSNKPQSITRELWSNAFDAHAMVGKQDVPFEVTFPTPMTPVFSCRDFGAGIAHENMEGFYTVLGHSTKENTNKAVGKWGVGRMSPMSYTDTFSVMSIHKGLVAYYTIQLGPDGSPKLYVLSEPVPTNQPDGLEVSFPVKRDDISSFQRAAEVVSYGFKVPPKVKNSQDKQFQPIKKSLTGDGYYFYDDSRLNGPHAQMGCVLYPISFNSIDIGLFPENNRNIIYEFNIGDLEVTASREALSYGANDPTISSLRTVLKAAKQSMVAVVQKEVDAQPSAFRAMKLLLRYSRLVGGSNQFTWQGKFIDKKSQLLDYPSIILHVGSKGYNNKTVGFGLEKGVYAIQDHTIFVQDLSDKKANARSSTRIAAALKSNQRFIWVKLEMNLPEAKASLDQMIHDLDFPVVYVKDLPDDGPVKTAPRGKLTVYTLTKAGLRPHDLSAQDFQNGGYYHPMEGGRYPPYFDPLAHFIGGQLGMPAILVPKPMWKKFEAATQWKLLEPKVDLLVKQYAAAAQIVLGDQYGTYPFTKLRGFKDHTGILGQFSRHTETLVITQFMDMDWATWDKQFQRLSLPVINNNRVQKDYNDVLDKYPLLKLYDGSDKMKSHFLHYANLIDNA